MAVIKQTGPLHTSHKTWCSCVVTAVEKACNCEGTPSPKQQLLARALDALVKHEQQTLVLMEAVSVLAKECVEEKKNDAARDALSRV